MEIHTNIEVFWVLWTLVGLAGIYPSVQNVRYQLRERAALKETGRNGAARLYVDGWTAIESLVLFAQITNILIGFVALFFVEPEVHIEDTSILLTTMLFLVTVALASRSWIAFLVRDHVYEYAEASANIKNSDTPPEEED